MDWNLIQREAVCMEPDSIGRKKVF